MSKETVTCFERYPLEPDQKIRILDGPRRGDWLVLEVGEKTMRLRCPVSGKEVEWDRFFWFATTLKNEEWPKRD